MRRVADWARYRIARALALPESGDYDADQYPRTLAGGWRYLREQVANDEVTWYEKRRGPNGRDGSW